MRRPKSALDVPADALQRARIRATVDDYFRGRNESPPVTYEALEGFASCLIESEKWEERYHAFIMVCCGNAIWRPVVSAIPFERRIFLLPRCHGCRWVAGLSSLHACKARVVKAIAVDPEGVATLLPRYLTATPLPPALAAAAEQVHGH